MKHGKKYVDGAKLIDRSKLYDVNEALDLCVKTGTAKFDETVEVHVKLGAVSYTHLDVYKRQHTGCPRPHPRDEPRRERALRSPRRAPP